MIRVRLPGGGVYMIPGNLKPCPYCENQNVEMISTGAGFYISCDVYGCNNPGYMIYTRGEKAVDAWNNGNTM